MELRDAIIDFLEQKKPEERSPTWDEIRVQPMVLSCRGLKKLGSAEGFAGIKLLAGRKNCHVV